VNEQYRTAGTKSPSEQSTLQPIKDKNFTAVCLIPLNTTNGYTPSATQIGRIRKHSQRHKLHSSSLHVPTTCLCTLSCKSEHEAGMFCPHTWPTMHTPLRKCNRANRQHTHIHTQGMARDSYMSNRLYTYFVTLQQLSTVNDTHKRATHGGSSFLSTHGYLYARDGTGNTGWGFHQI